MNPKIQKLSTDIVKTREKIAELQGKLQEMEQQKRELEDTEIIAIVRSIDIAPGDFAAFVEAYKSGGLNPIAPKSGVILPPRKETEYEE